MKLALSEQIKEIDRFATEKLGIELSELVDRSGEAVAEAVRKYTKEGGRVLILAGKGNNGADGYSAAIKLLGEYPASVIDVFGEGQRSPEGRELYDKFLSQGGEIIKAPSEKKAKELISNADTVVDAIFGTGFHGEIPECVKQIAVIISESIGVKKIAIDVPVGVNANDGSVDVGYAISVDATVELSFIKPGIVSYPAKAYVGEIIYDGIGLPNRKIEENFELGYSLVDSELVKELLPKRKENSNKSSFGKVLLITGSEKYRGAGILTLESALRSGAGYVTYLGTQALTEALMMKFPEAIYKTKKENSLLTDEDIKNITKESQKANVTLIGSGSDSSEGLRQLTLALLREEGGALVLDADAINAISEKREEAKEAIRESKREVILTPHPLEFSRISGIDVATVQANRIAVAKAFAAECRCILVLKGAGTVITNGKEVYINSSGSSALAKAGSGDVLAGAICSLGASVGDSMTGSVIAVYLHGKAADTAKGELSSYGVTPSDLPVRIAQELAKCEKSKQNITK